MKTGISVYFGDGMEHNERLIERARDAGAAYAFTSMHMLEEERSACQRDARQLLGLLRDAGIDLIADVSPATCERLGCKRLEELSDLGITHIRLDYGFSAERAVALSRVFRIVLNASTVTKADVGAWRTAGADFSRFTACHNYYPKRHTGLSAQDVRRTNDRLAALGFDVMGFVPGNRRLRGPLYEGLPTIEAQRERKEDLALNMLEASYGTGCDVVLVGDSGLTDESWERFGQLSKGYVNLTACLDERYSYLYCQVHHDRPDSSEAVIRSQESRASLRPGPIAPDDGAGRERSTGTIAVSNSGCQRYEGELEIARRELAGDARMNVVGTVSEKRCSPASLYPRRLWIPVGQVARGPGARPGRNRVANERQASTPLPAITPSGIRLFVERVAASNSLTKGVLDQRLVDFLTRCAHDRDTWAARVLRDEYAQDHINSLAGTVEHRRSAADERGGTFFCEVGVTYVAHDLSRLGRFKDGHAETFGGIPFTLRFMTFLDLLEEAGGIDSVSGRTELFDELVHHRISRLPDGYSLKQRYSGMVSQGG